MTKKIKAKKVETTYLVYGYYSGKPFNTYKDAMEYYNFCANLCGEECSLVAQDYYSDGSYKSRLICQLVF